MYQTSLTVLRCSKRYVRKEAHHLYRFFASGRYNCGYAIVSFELRKRQDIISDFFLRLVWPDKDKLTIEIPIKPNSDLPAVFSIVKKQQVKTVRKYFEDLVRYI